MSINMPNVGRKIVELTDVKIQEGWIWFQNWLANNADAVAIRERVENTLKKKGGTPSEDTTYFYQVPENQDTVVNITVSLDDMNNLGKEGVYEKIIRTITKNTTIKFWKITLPFAFGVQRLLIDWIQYSGYKDLNITRLSEGNTIVTFTHTNPSRFSSSQIPVESGNNDDLQVA